MPERIAGAVEEFLRLTSPVQELARTTTRPVELHGRTIPEDLDVDRPIARSLAYRSGAHDCLGATSARLQGRVVLSRILERFLHFTAGVDTHRPWPHRVGQRRGPQDDW
jgi:cytochrome P450